jgi:hypothetical protein
MKQSSYRKKKKKKLVNFLKFELDHNVVAINNVTLVLEVLCHSHSHTHTVNWNLSSHAYLGRRGQLLASLLFMSL